MIFHCYSLYDLLFGNIFDCIHFRNFNFLLELLYLSNVIEEKFNFSFTNNNDISIEYQG